MEQTCRPCVAVAGGRTGKDVKVESATSFSKGRLMYAMADCIILDSQALDQFPDAQGTVAIFPDYTAKGWYHKSGANAGLCVHGIAQLVHLPGFNSGRKARQVCDQSDEHCAV